MYFNIAFDVVTLILLGGIAVSNLIMTNKRIKNSGAFSVCVGLLAVSTIFDIMAALTGANIIWDSDELNVVYETLYMCFGVYSLYACFVAVASRIKYDYHKSSLLIFCFVSLYTLMLLINIPTHIMFNIIDGVFDNHFLFYVAYCIPIFVMVYSIVVLATSRKNIEKRLFRTMIPAVLAPVLGVIIQVIDDRLLLVQFGLGITVLILNFVWETPDSKQLKKTVAELEEARRQEEFSRREVEKADRVKSRFLSNISNELEQPIEEIQAYAREIRGIDVEGMVSAETDEIIKAGDHFKELLEKIRNNEQL